MTESQRTRGSFGYFPAALASHRRWPTNPRSVFRLLGPRIAQNAQKVDDWESPMPVTAITQIPPVPRDRQQPPYITRLVAIYTHGQVIGFRPVGTERRIANRDRPRSQNDGGRHSRHIGGMQLVDAHRYKLTAQTPFVKRRRWAEWRQVMTSLQILPYLQLAQTPQLR